MSREYLFNISETDATLYWNIQVVARQMEKGFFRSFMMRTNHRILSYFIEFFSHQHVFFTNKKASILTDSSPSKIIIWWFSWRGWPSATRIIIITLCSTRSWYSTIMCSNSSWSTITNSQFRTWLLVKSKREIISFYTWDPAFTYTLYLKMWYPYSSVVWNIRPFLFVASGVYRFFYYQYCTIYTSDRQKLSQNFSITVKHNERLVEWTGLKIGTISFICLSIRLSIPRS